MCQFVQGFAEVTKELFTCCCTHTHTDQLNTQTFTTQKALLVGVFGVGLVWTKLNIMNRLESSGNCLTLLLRSIKVQEKEKTILDVQNLRSYDISIILICCPALRLFNVNY